MSEGARGLQPVSLTFQATLLPLVWLVVLAIDIWYGLNHPQMLVPWVVAYPMFALYPWFVAYVAVRAQPRSAIITLGALAGTISMALALISNGVNQGPRGIVDSRPLYAAMTLLFGLGLLVAIRLGARIMRGGDRTLVGAVAAAAFFVATTAVAFFPFSIITT